MTAYTSSEWTDFFVACAGAAAALSGLLFVAVSINVERIVKYEGLADRALETIMLLVGALVAALISLVPGQAAETLGLELLVASGAFMAAIVILINRGVKPAGAPRSWLISRIGVSVLGSAPIVIGGLSLIVGSGGGLYWVFAGIVAAMVGGVLNAWVLLVEILR